MGINFNSGFNAGKELGQARNAKIRTTRVTIDGTTVRGTFPEQAQVQDNANPKITNGKVVTLTATMIPGSNPTYTYTMTWDVGNQAKADNGKKNETATLNSLLLKNDSNLKLDDVIAQRGINFKRI